MLLAGLAVGHLAGKLKVSWLGAFPPEHFWDVHMPILVCTHGTYLGANTQPVLLSRPLLQGYFSVGQVFNWIPLHGCPITWFTTV